MYKFSKRISPIRLEASTAKFLDNPYWRKYFEEAPSVACQKYIILEFYYSDKLGKVENFDDFKAEQERLQKEFTREDWAHLHKYCDNNPLKTFYREK